MLLSAELLAVTEGLPLLLLSLSLGSRPCSCISFACSDSLDCQKLSQSHFSVPCAGVEVVKWLKSFCRAVLSQGLCPFTYISLLGTA